MVEREKLRHPVLAFFHLKNVSPQSESKQEFSSCCWFASHFLVNGWHVSNVPNATGSQMIFYSSTWEHSTVIWYCIRKLWNHISSLLHTAETIDFRKYQQLVRWGLSCRYEGKTIWRKRRKKRKMLMMKILRKNPRTYRRLHDWWKLCLGNTGFMVGTIPQLGKEPKAETQPIHLKLNWICQHTNNFDLFCEVSGVFRLLCLVEVTGDWLFL